MASAANPPSSGSAAGDEGWRVLVVDDDVLNLRVAARLLRELGCRGALAPDGRTALRLAEEQVFDLVLLDIGMPDFNGQETLEALRARPGQRLHIVMVTGHDDDATRRHYLDLGADGFLSKPLVVSQLREAMQRIGARMPG